MKKSIITFTLLLLTVSGIEAKGGGAAGGVFGGLMGYSLVRSAGSNNRGRSDSYYRRKIHNKERRNERARKELHKERKELAHLKRELKEARKARRNRD